MVIMIAHTHSIRVTVAAIALPLLLAAGACTSASPNTPKVATSSDSVTHEENSRVAEGAAWTQHYFPSSDGSDVELHSDVLLPEGLAEGEQVPVILSVGAYFGHSGQTEDEDLAHTGPSDRFADFIEGTDLFDRGYALVMVDLRGFGGSTGCLDFMGAGEQADVEAAVDWAATQPWSTGSVGMYGKSYDAITGLVGNNLDQEALKAVVAQEPIWDLYRNIRSNGVPRSTIVDVSRSYNEIAALPQMDDDDDRYLANSTYEEGHPECTVLNSLGLQTADPESEFWKTRDLAAGAQGTDTPLFVTQGFLEWNTEPEGMEEYLTNHRGPERGWLGPWDHKRGNDRTADGVLEMGREGWFEETIAFFDQYLKGIEPSVQYPAYAVQDSEGAWRSQDTWPVVDSFGTMPLRGGSYVDDGAEGDPAVDTGNNFLQFSEPLAHATRITGTPRMSLDMVGHGNLMTKLYDVAPDGTAVVFDEQVSVSNSGTIEFDLKSTDWVLQAGHVLAVGIGTIEANVLSDWIDVPSNLDIVITGGRLDLALDDPADDIRTGGARAPYLDSYRAYAAVDLPAEPGSFAVPATRSAGPVG